MKIFELKTSPIETNTYVCIEGDKAFVVDVGGSAEVVYELIKSNGAKLDGILLTHAHFDHIGGVKQLLDIAAQDGKSVNSDDGGSENSNDENVPTETPCVFLHEADFEKVGSYKNMGLGAGVHVEKFVPDILLKGGETLSVAGKTVKVIFTPGHSKGSVCYVVDNVIFTGDTLFKCSYGRTDFYDGSFKDLKNAVINKLFRLKGDYAVLPGHGEHSNLAYEKKNNPIITTFANDTPNFAD